MPNDSETKLKQMTQALEAESTEERLHALQEAVQADVGGVLSAPFGDDVNNHVHTRYSFSPYSPSEVAFQARRAGLRVVGSVDHDSIGAASEMRTAARLVGMGATVGAEVRVDFSGTEFETRRLNNPDTPGNGYIVLHGVPQQNWVALAERLSPVNAAREERNRAQVARLNEIVAGVVGELDYDREVRPLSWADRGGSVTERHIMYALASRVVTVEPDPARAFDLITEKLNIPVSGTVQERLLDGENPHRLYDMLGAFKSELVSRIFVQPGRQECPPVREMTTLAGSLGAIPAYAYLGDVGESPTGDKKAQKFEDEYLDELLKTLVDLGFQAVTYMPPRNTLKQLKRVQWLAEQYELMQISGVDINSSRQEFQCPEIRMPEFRHLMESTWALVGHEAACLEDPDAGIFGQASPVADKPLQERIDHFAEKGRASTPAGT